MTYLFVPINFNEMNELSNSNFFRHLKQRIANYLSQGFSKEIKSIIIIMNFYKLSFIFQISL